VVLPQTTQPPEASTHPSSSSSPAAATLTQSSPHPQTNRQKKIKELLDDKHTAKGGTPEQQKLREQLQQLRTEWDTVLVRGWTAVV